MSIGRHVGALVLHIFGMVAGIKSFKGTVGKSFEGIGKPRSTADDARQIAIGFQVADESFPGELAQDLATLETMKDGRGFWKRGGQRRPIYVLLHCYGGINRGLSGLLCR